MTAIHTDLLRVLIAAQVQVIAHVDRESAGELPGPILNQLDYWLVQARKLVVRLSMEDKGK